MGLDQDQWYHLPGRQDLAKVPFLFCPEQNEKSGSKKKKRIARKRETKERKISNTVVSSGRQDHAKVPFCCPKLTIRCSEKRIPKIKKD